MSLLPDLAHLTLALPDYPEANLSCSSGPITLGLTTFALGRPYFEGLLRWLTEAPPGPLVPGGQESPSSTCYGLPLHLLS